MRLFGKNSKTPTVEITISNRTVVRVLVMTILSLIFFSALRKASHAIVLIATGMFVAIALNAPVHWVSQHLPGRRKGSRTLATAISFILVIGLLVGFLASIAPPLIQQTGSFIDAAPKLIEDTRSANNSVGRTIRRYNLEPQVEKFASQLGERTDDLIGSAFITVGKLTSSLFSVLAVLVIAFMTLIESGKWLNFVRSFVPKEKEKHFETISTQMYGVIRGYVNGQVLLAALAALIIVVPMFILNISYPVALMMIVFIAGLIPMVGHTIGAVIVTTVALFTSLGSAIGILIFYIIYQQIENYAVQPKVQANSTNLSPLLVFGSVLIGVSFGGLLGGLVAIPVTGCLKVLAEHYLADKRNGHNNIVTEKA